MPAKPTSDDVVAAVLAELSRSALAVGELLEARFTGYAQFEEWVSDNLPIHPHTAERLRAMWHLHHLRPGSPDLPPPWKAWLSLG